MEEIEILYGYKMTHDTGFAPNPYQGALTLATCKPLIRKYARIGYWISGWTSNSVQTRGNDKPFHFKDEEQRLIYLAKVSEVLSFGEYWNKYPQKRQPEKPIKGKKECFKSCANILVTNNDDISFCGDNIYEPYIKSALGFKQHDNPHHGEKEKERDLSGEHVLVCKEFYYFGAENAVFVKKKDVVHRWKKFSTDEGQKIIDFVTKNYSEGLYPKKK